MRADSLVVVLVVILQGASAASALERINTRPPTSAEAHRIASELAMDDSTLQKGDIVSTDRGFFVYRGIGADGETRTFDLGDDDPGLLGARVFGVSSPKYHASHGRSSLIGFARPAVRIWPTETAGLRVTLDRRRLSGLWKNLGDNGGAQFSTKSEAAL
jgi:hypothetical protein